MPRPLRSIVALAVIMILGMVGVARAAETSTSKSVSYQGITLSPAIVNVAVDQNLQQSSFKVDVSNNLSTSVSLKLSSLDFKSLNQSGGVAFVGSGTSHGLANWLVLPSAPITLKPHAHQLVTINVDNRADLSPGGHYAAVLFKNTASSKTSSNKVDINQVLATLVFLKKSGGETYSLQAARPDFGASWLHLPGNINLVLKNTGNTQTVPRGIITITAPNGKEVKRGIINTESGMVLPDSERLFQTSLFSVSRPAWPGRYTAHITYRPADTKTAVTDEYSFFYVNLPAILAAIIYVLIAIFAIRFVRRKLAKR